MADVLLHDAEHVGTLRSTTSTLVPTDIRHPLVSSLHSGAGRINIISSSGSESRSGIVERPTEVAGNSLRDIIPVESVVPARVVSQTSGGSSAIATIAEPLSPNRTLGSSAPAEMLPDDGRPVYPKCRKSVGSSPAWGVVLELVGRNSTRTHLCVQCAMNNHVPVQDCLLNATRLSVSACFRSDSVLKHIEEQHAGNYNCTDSIYAFIQTHKLLHGVNHDEPVGGALHFLLPFRRYSSERRTAVMPASSALVKASIGHKRKREDSTVAGDLEANSIPSGVMNAKRRIPSFNTLDTK